ncbi:MAG TPA: hypothetical protein PLC99_25310 [Verrucomicrobiota bacterium]|nr:hypothetical protein [Verrucomicrobiota bacterium]
MGWFALRIAKLFGQRLPAFPTKAEAEAHLFSQRDERLRHIIELAPHSAGVFAADFTPNSLKGLESWYFILRESDSFGSLGITCEEFERCMAMYYCETAVRNNPDAQWVVQEYAFERGKYEMGVAKGGTYYMRMRFTDHYKQPNNKRRQKIFRDYQQYYGA